MNERVTLSMEEIKRGYVLQQVEEKKLSGREAAQRLGLSLRQVRRLLVSYRGAGASGLALGSVAERAGTGARPGLVVEQKKPAESWVARGSAIDLVVAAAEDVATVRMPDVRGMALKEAYGTLQRSGFRKPDIEAVPAEGAEAETVLDQDPPPGQPVSRDAAVSCRWPGPCARSRPEAR